jgi:hypothetical protein
VKVIAAGRSAALRAVMSISCVMADGIATQRCLNVGGPGHQRMAKPSRNWF